VSKSVLITGAAGFIGSHLTDHCLARGWRVTAIDSFSDFYAESQKRRNLAQARAEPSFSLIEGDLLQLELGPLVREADVVFHLAAQPGVRPSWTQFDHYVRENIAATQRLLHAATTTSLDRFVLASSSSIYGDALSLPTSEDVLPRPVSPYGVTKLTAEHLAQVYWRTFDVPTVALRYFTVYGPRQRPDMAFNRLLSSALSGEPFELFGDGEQTRDFTFVSDAVEATLAAGERGRPGSVYNVGGGSSRSMNQVCDLLADLISAPVHRVHGSPQIGDARHTAADIARAQRDLGFRPRTPFEAGLQAQLDWQRLAAGGTIQSSTAAHI
jgi:UDP-glucuronate 4-epimerase